jgi:hypothetical protein
MIKKKSNVEIILKALLSGLPMLFNDFEYRIINNQLCHKIIKTINNTEEECWRVCDDWTLNWFLKKCDEKTEEDIINIIYGLAQIEEKLEKNPEMERWFNISK